MTKGSKGYAYTSSDTHPWLCGLKYLKELFLPQICSFFSTELMVLRLICSFSSTVVLHLLFPHLLTPLLYSAYTVNTLLPVHTASVHPLNCFQYLKRVKGEIWKEIRTALSCWGLHSQGVQLEGYLWGATLDIYLIFIYLNFSLYDFVAHVLFILG